MVEILFIFVPRPCDSFLAYGGQRPLFMQLGHVFYLCISNFKNTRSNCKPIHNAFLHSCVGVKPQILSIFTLHKPTLWLSPEPPYKGGHSWVTVAPHPFGIAVYTGIFPSVGFFFGTSYQMKSCKNVCLVIGMHGASAMKPSDLLCVPRFLNDLISVQKFGYHSKHVPSFIYLGEI